MEELDQINMGRYLRALEARSIERVEERRTAQIDGTIKELRSDEWRRIREHDALMREIDDAHQ